MLCLNLNLNYMQIDHKVALLKSFVLIIGIVCLFGIFFLFPAFLIKHILVVIVHEFTFNLQFLSNNLIYLGGSMILST
jgi:hypothetical protein